MKLLYKNPLFSAFIFALLAGCSSNHTDKKNTPQAATSILDTSMLKYDPKTGDKRIERYIEELHRKRNFNGNILVAKNGKIIYQKSIGWADYLLRDSLNINSRFQLASVSKPFTATAILMLADSKKLNLDDDIRKYLPVFPNTGITIRMLLTHTSGLNNYQYFAEKHCDRKTPIYNDDVIKMFADYKPAPYGKPGQSFFYCNTNFMLLGSIIEKVSGKKYAAFMKEKIFDPLGMKNTVVYSKYTDAKVPTNVWGYDRTWRYSVVPNYLDGVIGDKGIYSTVKDLFVFDQALQAGKLLSHATMAKAYEPSNANPKHHKHFNYGFGWRLFEEDNGRSVVYHTGWWHGFQNIFVRDISNKTTIVILSNLRNGSIAQLDELYTMLGTPVIRKGAYSD